MSKDAQVCHPINVFSATSFTSIAGKMLPGVSERNYHIFYPLSYFSYRVLCSVTRKSACIFLMHTVLRFSALVSSILLQQMLLHLFSVKLIPMNQHKNPVYTGAKWNGSGRNSVKVEAFECKKPSSLNLLRNIFKQISPLLIFCFFLLIIDFQYYFVLG